MIVDLIFGLPTESRELFIENLVRLILDVSPDGVNINRLRLVPGTKYYKLKDCQNYMIKEIDGHVLATRNMSYDDIETIRPFVAALRIGYELHPRTIRFLAALNNWNLRESLAVLGEWLM